MGDAFLANYYMMVIVFIFLFGSLGVFLYKNPTPLAVRLAQASFIIALFFFFVGVFAYYLYILF